VSRSAIILDRDGTLVDFVRDEETGAILSAFHPSHLRLLPGVREGLLALQGAGYLLAVASNQPGPAKGQCSRAAIEQTNRALVAALLMEGVRIEAVFTCIHHPTGGPGGDPSLVTSCECRKPKPGLVDQLVSILNLDRGRSWVVGDTYVDLECGRAAGMHVGLLMAPGRCEFCPLPKGPYNKPDVVGPTLVEVAEKILALRWP